MNETPTADLIGTVIDGKYRIDSLIGKGGMGKVYKATHLQLNKVFALKIMHFERTATSGSVESTANSQIVRFKREVEVLVKINHPNVVMVTDFGFLPPEEMPYIVMEFIEGTTLRQMMKETSKLPEKHVLQITRQICAGLHAAHTQSIVHRDLKPENVMVQKLPDGEVMARVLDFGIAKLLERPGENNEGESLTGAGMPGTPKYMAPEQMFGTKVDARADIFAIGLMMYEMLTGILPLVLMSKVKAVSELRPDTTPRLSDIIFKAISKEPDERYQTALDLRRDLENMEQDALVESELSKRTKILEASNVANRQTLANRTMTATDPNLPVRVPDAPAKSRAGIAFLGVVVVLAGGLGGLWAFVPQFRELFTPPSNAANTKLDATLIPQTITLSSGKFQMGDNKGDTTSKPEHQVECKAFQAAKFLVTNRQYAEFVKRTNHRAPVHWRGVTPPGEIMDKPVTNVSWDDANDYCQWLARETGRAFRLLTEPEWEMIARDATHFGLAEVLDKNLEWTGSPLKPYPGASWQIPADRPDLAKAKIFRGEREDPDHKKVDPNTFRSFQTPDFTQDNLSFRVACDGN
ncbi:MAG: protein kinase [Blastocatellia bacterium]|nr:protein kinase [Blastocatellia bacterium]